MQQSAALDIYLPKTDGHINDLPFSLDKTSIRHWVDNLPLINTGATVKQIYQALVSTNRCQLDPSDLITVLEMLHAPIEHAVKALNKHFVNIPHPLNPKGKQIASLTAEIYKEMSIGYKHIVKKSAINSSAQPNTPLMLSGLQNTLYYLSKIFVTLSQAYSPSSKNTWKEIHQIYRYAEANKLHRIEIENTFGESALRITTSISDTYKTILLLSIANPYRLDGNQISQLRSALESYASLASISQSADPENPLGQFIINLDEDSKPTPLILYKKEITPSSRVISTIKMTQHLKRDIESARLKSKDIFSKELFESLIPAWETRNKRKTLRSKRKSEGDIAIGLTASHRKLKEKPVEAELLALDNDDATILYSAEEEKYKQFNVQACTIVNRSAKGYGLEWNGDKNQLIRIGELIAIKDQPKKKSTSVWNICLVRWIQHTPEGNLQFGVQLLSSNAQAVKAKTYDKNNPKAKAMLECLLIPANASLKVPASVITPGLFRVEQQLSIEFDDEKYVIELTKQVRAKTSFKQFQYIISEQSEKPKLGSPFSGNGTTNSPAKKEDDPFGNIWSSI